MAQPAQPLTRGMVSAAVAQYGLAWTSQSPDLIAALFTDSATYVERPFDPAATFTGKQAIHDYWVRQICGKQSDVTFHHCEEEMVLDAERRVAVVTWLAEFNNQRFMRSEDQTHKRVRFCQVAKLHFSPDGTQIEHLEEYAQDASQARFRWPQPIAACSGERFRDAVRGHAQVPELQCANLPKPCTCDRCGCQFISRTALFRHLRAEGPCSGAVGRAPGGGETVKVALAVSYSKHDPQDGLLESQLLARLQRAVGTAAALKPSFAVPPCWSDGALVNVVALSLPSATLPAGIAAAALNTAQLLPVLTHQMNAVLAVDGHRAQLQVLGSYLVHKSFDPRRWNESQLFRVSLPWLQLVATPQDATCCTHAELRQAVRKLKAAGRLLGGGSSRRSWHNYTTDLFAKGSTTSSVVGSPKIRCQAMDPDSQPRKIDNHVADSTHATGFCVITIAVPGKHVPTGYVRKICGVLVAHCRGELSEAEISSSFELGAATTDLPILRPDTDVMLVAPRMPRYSALSGISLDVDGQSEAVASIDHVAKIEEAHGVLMNKV